MSLVNEHLREAILLEGLSDVLDAAYRCVGNLANLLAVETCRVDGSQAIHVAAQRQILHVVLFQQLFRWLQHNNLVVRFLGDEGCEDGFAPRRWQDDKAWLWVFLSKELHRLADGLSLVLS